MNRLEILLCARLCAPLGAEAATLYRWIDASGTARYGYQPPSGVAAEPAEAEQRELSANPPASCRELTERHLALIDREIARIKALKTGYGPEYELTPAAGQELLLDLYAHRAALLTGRPAADFRAPTFAEAERAKSRLQSENAKMRNALESQQAALDAQSSQLKRARREADSAWRWLRPWGRGRRPVVPGVPYYVPP
jgi:hypothetical protein